MRRVVLKIDEDTARKLAVLDESGNVEAVIMRLIDHAQQGVYRPGAWERAWLEQAFGDEWQERLEPDTDFTVGGRAVFDRVRR